MTQSQFAKQIVNNEFRVNSPWIHFFLHNDYEFTNCFAFHCKYIIFFANSLIFCEFPMNSLFASRFLFEFTILFRELTVCYAISLWIHYLFWETTLNSLLSHFETILKSVWNRYLLGDFFYYLFREFTFNSLSTSRFHNEFTFFIATSLVIYYSFREFTICFENVHWIHDLFSETTMNSAIHFKFRIRFAISLWIHYLFIEFTLNPLFPAKSPIIHYLLRELTLNSLSYSRNHYENTFFFAISQWIHCPFREFTLNPFFHYELIIFSTILQWIHYPFREVTENSLSITRIHF